MIQIFSPSEESTRQLGEKIGALLKPGDMVALWGDLGTGKTFLARAIIQFLTGSSEEVPSPTFTLVQTYDTSAGPVGHYDLYRLSTPEDITELGWDEAHATTIALVEWPERLGPLLPPNRLDIRLSYHKEGRGIELIGHGTWVSRLASFSGVDHHG